MKAVYKLHADCGRMGTLHGVFVAEKEYMNHLVESKIEVRFGEVLGKHSDVFGAIEAKDFTMVSDNQEVVKVIVENKLSSGYNPLEYPVMGRDDSEDDETVGEYIERKLTT